MLHLSSDTTADKPENRSAVMRKIRRRLFCTNALLGIDNHFYAYNSPAVTTTRGVSWPSDTTETGRVSRAGSLWRLILGEQVRSHGGQSDLPINGVLVM